MKLKPNKSFQAINVDSGDELYPNVIFEFNITKLIEHIKVNPDAFPVEEVALDTLWESSLELDETAIQAANLAVPIILAEISPGRFNVVDGNHRVAKARRDGFKSLPAYKVSPDRHYRFLTSANAYKKYVEYWNSKVADIGRATKYERMEALGFRS